MTAVVTVACWLAMQQLAAAPESPSVGDVVAVRASLAAAPAVGVAVAVVLPDGGRQEIGATDAAGEVRFVPETAGQHTFVAEVGGVRCLTPVFAQGRGGRWLLALASVPLGLALLWVNLRHLRRVAVEAAGD
ncbi:MAG: hypothetical protein R3F29_12715 [Planctomycetota bacterium]|nr:hypothetical protein [Planctomycetota bacterium]